MERKFVDHSHVEMFMDIGWSRPIPVSKLVILLGKLNVDINGSFVFLEPADPPNYSSLSNYLDGKRDGLLDSDVMLHLAVSNRSIVLDYVASERLAVLSVSGQWLANDERFLKRFASFSKPIGNWLKCSQAVLAREDCFHTWASFEAMVTNPEVAVIDLRLIKHAEIVAAIREILRE